MNDNVDVSVIIVNYNTTSFTKQAIESVIAQTKDNTFEIIVVDNNSPDRSIEGLKQEFEKVVFIFSDTNSGFGAANNLGFKVAKGKYYFLLNSDAYLIEDSVKIFFNFMDKLDNKDVACCGGNLVDDFGKNTTSYGNLPTFFEAFSRLGFAMFYPKYYRSKIASGIVSTSLDIINVGYITGADMFIRRSAIEKVGGFDSDFFLYFEETELCFRFANAGMRVAFLPITKLVHLEGGSQKVSDKFNYTHIKRFATSRKLYFTKCKGKIYANAVMIVYALQSVLFSIVKFSRGYLKIALINLKA